MNKKQIFENLQKASDLYAEANRLTTLCMAAILELSSQAHTKSDNIIETLVAPENGDIYTIEKLAKVLKFSKSTIYRLCKEGKLPHHKPGSGKLIFYRHEITKFLKESKNTLTF